MGYFILESLCQGRKLPQWHPRTASSFLLSEKISHEITHFTINPILHTPLIYKSFALLDKHKQTKVGESYPCSYDDCSLKAVSTQCHVNQGFQSTGCQPFIPCFSLSFLFCLLNLHNVTVSDLFIWGQSPSMHKKSFPKLCTGTREIVQQKGVCCKSSPNWLILCHYVSVVP